MWPSDANDSLRQRLQALDDVRAEFQQEISNAQGFVLEQASGHMLLAKPKFLWQVDAPFEQTIVADGVQVLIYDPDLEQVTERAVGNSIDQAPLALLTNQQVELEQYFSVQRETVSAQESVFTLYPKAPDALFARLELHFDQERMTTLLILDHLGQQTKVAFLTYQPDADLQDELFELDLPDDVDRVKG